MRHVVNISKAYQKKNVKLSLELDTYMANHPEVWDLLPDGALLIITSKSDKKFSETSLAIAKSHKKHYKPGQPVFIAEKSRTRWSFDCSTLAAT